MIADQTGGRRRVGKLHESRRAILNSIRQESIRRAGDLPSLSASESGSQSASPSRTICGLTTRSGFAVGRHRPRYRPRYRFRYRPRL